MASKKLTPKQIAQLGGFGAAKALGDEGVKARGSKGGNTTMERYGREAFVRAAHARWGRKLKAPSRAESTVGSGA